MRVGIIISLAIIVLFGCGGYQGKPVDRLPCPEDGGVIFGCVTDSLTGKPVWGGAVQLVGTQRGSMVDQNGNYLIKCIAPGKYTLRFSSIEHNTADIKDVLVGPLDLLRVDQVMSKKIVDLSLTFGIPEKTKVIADSASMRNEIMSGVSTNFTQIAPPKNLGITRTVSDEETDLSKPMTTVDSLLTNVTGIATNYDGQTPLHVTYGNPEPIIVEIDPIAWPDKDDSTGMIAGTITDSITGEPIMGVAVSLNSDSSGLLTTYKGEYHYGKLKPGMYQLKLEGVKYTTRIITNVEVRAGEVTEITSVLRAYARDITIFAPHFIDTVDAGNN